MGKGYAKKKPRVLKRDFKQKRPDEWEEKRIPNENGDGYKETPTENEAFEAYYKKQGIVSEGEWEAFMACLRTPLPATFRINGTGRFAAQLRDKLETDFFSKLQQEPLEVEGEKLVPPRPLPWYPNKLAWQLTYSRTQLRKLKALTEVHELLKQENTSGGITRQEAVSMAPPLFLDIQSQHKILDTCAAPGSKTVQMLEMLHEETELPTGFVIANDSEPQRCNLLVHQTKRMHSPALVVTNHDASAFPLLNQKSAPKSEALYFDRILCDVPCSGDGTLRKAPDLWRRWTVNQGTGLHPLQVRITLHTAGLLKVGGRMVYSTCSFNPVEDEAVVAEVLRQAGGALELISVADKLLELKRCPGVKQWVVKGTKGEYFSSLAAAEQASNANSFSASMFPDEDSAKMPLDRCMRILPHHGDTGGFFIAVMEKRADLPPLQPERWKRSKDRMAERRRDHKQQKQQEAVANGASQQAVKAEGDADLLKDSEQPLPFADRTGAASTAEQRSDTKEFGQDMEDCADAAAQAAVTFADAIADQDPPEATKASEEAADAVEEVAELAEARSGNQAGLKVEEPQASVGSRQADGTDGAIAKKAENKRQRRRKPGEEPIQLVKDTWVLDSIVDFFGLDPEFPIRQQLVTRSGVKDEKGARKIYFVSSGIIDMVLKDEDEAVKVTSAGLKVFERNDKKDPCAGSCVYRMSQDGLPVMLPHVKKQILQPTATEMLRLLKERFVALPAAQKLIPEQVVEGPPQKKAKPDPAGFEQAVNLKTPMEDEDPVKEAAPQEMGERIEPQAEAHRIPLSDLETLRQLEGIRGGCCICTLRDSEATSLGFGGSMSSSGSPGTSQMAIVCWRGRSSISILVDKVSAVQLAEKLEDAIQKFASHHAPETVKAPSS